MTVRLLQQAETQLSLAHDDLRTANPTKKVLASAQEHVRQALLLVREALADTLVPHQPRINREAR